MLIKVAIKVAVKLVNPLESLNTRKQSRRDRRVGKSFSRQSMARESLRQLPPNFMALRAIEEEWQCDRFLIHFERKVRVESIAVIIMAIIITASMA